MTFEELQIREREAAQLPEGKWRCSACKRVFDLVYTAEWTKEMQAEEYRKNHGNHPLETAAVICDDCYKACVAWHESRDGGKN